MRIPNISNIRQTDEDFDREYDLKHIEYYYEPTKTGFDISDEKSKTKFVDYIEKIVRSSFEYRSLITFLRDHIDMNKCSYFNKVNNRLRGITIEIHHEPFSLYDIAYIVIEKFIDEDIPLEPAMIAEEVMLLHYHGLVGLIPLSKTVHELVHDNQIFIPITHVYGNISEFYNLYSKYITDHQKETLMRSIKLSEEIACTPPNVLKKKFTYLDIDGMILPKYVEKKSSKK